MARLRSPESFDDEVLTRFPELARARMLFVDLFQDRTPLVNLGYSPRQIEWVVPTLKLIEGPGEIDTHLKLPSLHFYRNNEDPDCENMEIYMLDNGGGYSMSGVHDKTMSRREVESGNDLLYRFLFSKNPVQMYEIYGGQVAEVAMFKPEVDTNNLNYLIGVALALMYYAKPVFKDNALARLGKRMNIVGTFSATWVDERKNEFVIKTDIPQEQSKPEYFYWKRLKSLINRDEEFTPFGSKPSVSHQQVDRLLAAKKYRILEGHLAQAENRISIEEYRK